MVSSAESVATATQTGSSLGGKRLRETNLGGNNFFKNHYMSPQLGLKANIKNARPKQNNFGK